MDSLELWRGSGIDIKFKPTDFEVTELALGIIPELRICAMALKWARKAGIHYPVEDVEQIVKAFPHTKFQGGGHEITTDSIRALMPSEYFPIQHEGELLSKAYLSLMRCKIEAASQRGPIGASSQLGNSKKEVDR